MKKFGLSNNQLKLIAMLAMTVDHVGAYLFPGMDILRIIGRIAYPIFAYMIAEGCFYTRHPGRYIGSMAALAGLIQIACFLQADSLYQYIPTTFTLSIGLILLLKWSLEKRKLAALLLFWACVLTTLFITEGLPYLWFGTDFGVDYGFFGVMLPVMVYLCRNRWQKLLVEAVMLVLLWLQYGYVQYWALLAIPLLALYNGQRGKWKLKWLFYIYFPAHLAGIFLVGFLL